MLIRALKTTTGLPRGCVGDVDETTGKELIALGYAIEELPLAKQEAAPVAANDNIPFEIAQTGGLTGADVPPSLSPEGQAQETPTCPQSEDEGQSERSPSTTDTGSSAIEQDKTRTSFTPATTTGGKRKRGRPSSKG